ncbi:MAG TPA: FMN-binding protein [Tenericutes bacterium]|nr:FMN-binding protein [Mycoplasmatota bacterium]
MEIIRKTGPYIKDDNNTTKIMFNLLISLFPIILFTFYKNGIIPFYEGKTNVIEMFYPLIFIITGALTSFVTETIYFKLFLKIDNNQLLSTVKRSYAIFPGLFLSLVLPINTPITILILGSFIATLVGKLLFGGFGNNIFNPALIGALFITSAYSIIIANNGGYLNKLELDTISGATPLANTSLVEGIGTYQELVSPYGTLKDFFIGFIPGSVGETSAFLCLVAFIYLTYTKVIKWRIPTVYISTVFLMTYIIGAYNDLGIWYPLFQILSGGLFFGAVFMATDPVTSPTTPIGQVIYGMFLGILTVIFRYMTSYPEGVLTSILTMNMFVFIIDRICSKARFNFSKSKYLFIACWSLIIIVSMFIATSFNKDSTETDPNFNIISKDVSNNKISYVVTQKGYVGNIKASVTVDDGKIIDFKVIEQNESFYSKIESDDYINTLIKGQDNLESIDTLSGVTVTSSALKRLLINTIKDYKNGSKENIINEDTNNSRNNFEIIKMEDNNDEKIYYASNLGFRGKIILKITVLDKTITKIEIDSSNEDYMEQMIDSGFFDNLVNNQNNIDSVDAVSGATVSSNAVKELLKKFIKEYEEYKNE